VWVFTDREVLRLLALTPRRAVQLRQLGLLHPADQPGSYAFREVVSLRVAKALLEQGLTVRQVRTALGALRRLVPDSDAPLAELRVVVRGGEVFIERDAQLLEPSGQIVMEFSGKELAEAARDTVLRGLVRPIARPETEAERWFELGSQWDGDPAQWERAMDAYQRVTTLDPRNAAAWNNLGLLHHRLGRYDDARRHYEVAVAAATRPVPRRPTTWAPSTTTWATSRRPSCGTGAPSRCGRTMPTPTSTWPPRSSGEATARWHVGTGPGTWSWTRTAAGRRSRGSTPRSRPSREESEPCGWRCRWPCWPCPRARARTWSSC
jgi:tetratricopeptide (TPR) repeat protein